MLTVHKVSIMHEVTRCSLVCSGVEMMQHSAGCYSGNELLFWQQSLFTLHRLDVIPGRGASLLCSGMCARWCFMFIECFVLLLGYDVSVFCHQWLVYLIMFVSWNKTAAFVGKKSICAFYFLQSWSSSTLIFSNKFFCHIFCLCATLTHSLTHSLSPFFCVDVFLCVYTYL